MALFWRGYCGNRQHHNHKTFELKTINIILIKFNDSCYNCSGVLDFSPNAVLRFLSDFLFWGVS